MQRSYTSPLMLSLMTLMGIGLVQVYSSSFIFATESFGDGLYFFKKQLFFVVLALAALVGASLLPLKIFERWGWLLWGIASIGVVATLIPGFGVKVGGASRWLNLPMGFRFEPSELLKLSFAIIFASIMVRSETTLAKVKWHWIALLVAAPLLLLLKQPDFGSFAIIIFVAYGLLFVFGLKWRYIISSVLLVIPMFYYLVMLKPYRKARVMAFIDPWSDPEQSGFQVIQSMLSFHSGGVTGVGLGHGQGKLFFLPEAHTDFTLAVLGEEMGFVGFVVILSLYGFIILRGLQIAVKADNLFHKAFAAGLSMTFALSIFINAGVVMGMLPPKGLTLPFLSYGGSSLVVFSLMFGFLVNIERHLIQGSQSPFLRAKSHIK